MRVVYLGGTRFIGRAAVRHLAEAGHDIMVVHRGGDVPCAERERVFHCHADRRALAGIAGDITAFAPDVVIDGYVLTRRDATDALNVLPGAARLVVLSSADVYRAYASRDRGAVTDPVPLDESAPLREERYPYRGRMPGMDDYEKLDVEEAYLRRDATVLRLGFVYGPHDQQRREEFILRRVRAGRRQIPIGAGNWLVSRLFVEDAARAIRLSAEAGDIGGEVFNVGELKSPTVRLWAQEILAAADSDAELVRVSDRLLPGDLRVTGAIGQPMLIDASKLRRRVGWVESPTATTVAASVAWHLQHPPLGAPADFSEDDRALAAVPSTGA